MKANQEEVAIIIPARFGSSRFPGKPLALLAGVPMLERVVQIGRGVANALRSECSVFVGVATDDERIILFCEQRQIPVCQTDSDIASGTERSFAALSQFHFQGDLIVSLQGDNPLVPPGLVAEVVRALKTRPNSEVITPIIQLDWQGLASFREGKRASPFSGTTVVRDREGRALWFSKQIIPSIRNEAMWQQQTSLSPVFRHIGLYGFRRATLERFCLLPKGFYEELEGLEQLRLLENGISIDTIECSPELMPPLSGIDTKEDLIRAEEYLYATRD